VCSHEKGKQKMFKIQIQKMKKDKNIKDLSHQFQSAGHPQQFPRHRHEINQRRGEARCRNQNRDGTTSQKIKFVKK